MSVQSARPRPRLTKEARREQLLEAALRVFVRGGYHGTHVEQVIREAGVARGTFYLHFRSKHEVFAALVERMLAIFLHAKPAIPDPEVRTIEDAETILRRSSRVVLETFRRHRQLCRLLFDEAVGADKGFSDVLARHFRVWHERVRSTLALFAEKGVVRPDLDLDVTADLVLGMVERVTRRHLLGERAPDLDRLVDAIVSFELRGIRAAR
jgi:TetR/AcrR family acrAB operon transcriptional repressor